jgi:transcriptional regulator with XRE-family HTH domain
MTDSIHTAEYKRFLERLRKARSDAKLTQAQVAEALGQPQSFVSKCESGERRVDVVELLWFARAFGHSPSYFIKGLGEE